MTQRLADLAVCLGANVQTGQDLVVLAWDVEQAPLVRAVSADGHGDHTLVDGGTFANNPTLSSYVDALRLKKEIPRIVVVSIGTGLPPQIPGSGRIPIEADKVAEFGLVKWARPILEVVLDGVPKAVEYQMRAIQAANRDALEYYRLQSDLPSASHALDDASRRTAPSSSRTPRR